MTETEKALALVDSGTPPYRAAHEIGIAPATLYVAIKKRKAAEVKAQGICPCCGQKLPSEKSIDT